jgi:Flp pilus assembly protein TadD
MRRMHHAYFYKVYSMNFPKWQHFLRARFFQLLSQDDAALNEYRLAINSAPDFTRAMTFMAFINARHGNFAAAAASFRDALQLEPGNAELSFNLGYSCDKQGQRQEAIAAFKTALQINPKHDRAWYGLGMCHAALGDHQSAAAALQEAATLQPMNPHAWYALGMAYQHLNEPERVKEIIFYLHRFDPKMTRQLIQEAGRSDLAYLVADLVS